MKFSTLSRRVAATGAVTALAAGALVAVTAATADAAEPVTGDTTYTCTFPVIGEQQVPVTTEVPDISAYNNVLPAGAYVPAGVLSANYTFHAPAALAALLGNPAVTDPGVSDMTMQLGSVAVPVSGFAFDLASATPNDSGGIDVPASGSNPIFQLPAAGTAGLSMPSAFTFVANVGGLAVSAPCSTDTPAELGALEIPLGATATNLKASAAKVKPGKSVKLSATSSGPAVTPTGQVVFKDGDKTLATKNLNSDGVASFKVKHLKKGKHKFTATYLGDTFNDTSTSKTVVVKAKR